jgi:hypothetical protein
MQSFSQGENTQSIPKKILIIDIDHNIIEFFVKADQQTELSKSVDLSSSVELNEPELIPNVRALKGNLISRKSWLEIFKEIIVVNKQYEELHSRGQVPKDTNLLIRFQFLTTASYTQEEFMKVFKQAYKELDHTDIEKYLIGTDPSFYNNRQNQFKYFGQFQGSGAELKSQFMEKKYNNNWAREGYKKTDIILVDDSQDICEQVKSKGFSAIHHPTSPRRRPSAVMYSDAKENVFNNLRELVSSSKNYCEAVANKKSVGK